MLEKFSTFTFRQPATLLLIPLAAATIVAWRRWKTPAPAPAFAFSSITLLDEALDTGPASWRVRLARLPEWLIAAALVMVVVAFAGPVSIRRDLPAERLPPVLLAIDVSGSMEVRESVAGQPMRRIDRLRRALGALLDRLAVAGPDRKPIPVGIIRFAESVEFLVPPTIDRGFLDAKLAALEPERRASRTNLGDAIAIGVDLATLDARGTAASESTPDRTTMATESANAASQSPRTGVVIVGTDGAHNVSEGLNPGVAGRIAERFGVPIHALAISAPTAAEAAVSDTGVTAKRRSANGASEPVGSASGANPSSVNGDGSNRPADPGADRSTLSKIAGWTGGMVLDPDAPGFDTELDLLVDSIADRAERSAAAAPPRLIDRTPFPIITALGLVTVALVLRGTLLRIRPS